MQLPIIHMCESACAMIDEGSVPFSPSTGSIGLPWRLRYSRRDLSSMLWERVYVKGRKTAYRFRRRSAPIIELAAFGPGLLSNGAPIGTFRIIASSLGVDAINSTQLKITGASWILLSMTLRSIRMYQAISLTEINRNHWRYLYTLHVCITSYHIITLKRYIIIKLFNNYIALEKCII